MKEAYRDGILMWTKGEVFEGPNQEIIEILYTEGGEKKFFVELPGIPACAHGETIEEAIEAAIEKRDGTKPITKDEKEKYKANDFKFSVRVFRRLTGACKVGVDEWLKRKRLDSSVKMTIDEIRNKVPSQWVRKLEDALR